MTYNEAGALSGLGIYLESAGAWNAAIEHLAEANAIFLRLGTPSDCLEPQAVQARCLLAPRQYEEARQLASEVWT
jgi:hypothetical protein